MGVLFSGSIRSVILLTKRYSPLLILPTTALEIVPRRKVKTVAKSCSVHALRRRKCSLRSSKSRTEQSNSPTFSPRVEPRTIPVLPSFPDHFVSIPNPFAAAKARFPRHWISTLTKERPMKVITIGKRLVSADQVAFVEPFDPAANPEFK